MMSMTAEMWRRRLFERMTPDEQKDYANDVAAYFDSMRVSDAEVRMDENARSFTRTV